VKSLFEVLLLHAGCMNSALGNTDVYACSMTSVMMASQSTLAHAVSAAASFQQHSTLVVGQPDVLCTADVAV
jgi:hypothetical protein